MTRKVVINIIPYPQRTHSLRLLGPKTLLYNIRLWGYFDAKGTSPGAEHTHTHTHTRNTPRSLGDASYLVDLALAVASAGDKQAVLTALQSSGYVAFSVHVRVRV